MYASVGLLAHFTHLMNARNMEHIKMLQCFISINSHQSMFSIILAEPLLLSHKSKTVELPVHHVRYSLWEMCQIHRMVGTFLIGLTVYFFRRTLKRALMFPTAIF
jgi:hypothetical protein